MENLTIPQIFLGICLLIVVYTLIIIIVFISLKRVSDTLKNLQEDLDSLKIPVFRPMNYFYKKDYTFKEKLIDLLAIIGITIWNIISFKWLWWRWTAEGKRFRGLRKEIFKIKKERFKRSFKK